MHILIFVLFSIFTLAQQKVWRHQISPQKWMNSFCGLTRQKMSWPVMLLWMKRAWTKHWKKSRSESLCTIVYVYIHIIWIGVEGLMFNHADLISCLVHPLCVRGWRGGDGFCMGKGVGIVRNLLFFMMFVEINNAEMQ